MKKSDHPIITKQIFNTSKEQLWNAITSPEKMKQWYFEIMPDFKPEVGFKTNFRISVEDRQYTHQWEVTEVVKQERIRYNWNYKEHPGDSYVDFEIKTKEHQLELIVTCQITEDFPQDLPEFKRESAIAGWSYLIQDSLVKFLEK